MHGHVATWSGCAIHTTSTSCACVVLLLNALHELTDRIACAECKHQAITALLLSNLHSEYRPIAVLTDLVLR